MAQTELHQEMTYVDTFTKDKRRAIMQAVRRQRTRPEEALALLLREAGVKFRRNVADLPGTPDFYVPARNMVIFVHGCFWHGHAHCHKGRNRPRTNRTYWQGKVDRNKRRDRRVARQLRERAISVFTIWECELKRELPPRLRLRLCH